MSERLRSLVQTAIEDLKGVDVEEFDVRGLTSITDFMVIASGRSDRHVKAIAGGVVTAAKSADKSVLGIEGERDGEWVLIDLGDVIVHVMQPRVRDFYKLEKLWGDGDGSRRHAES